VYYYKILFVVVAAVLPKCRPSAVWIGTSTSTSNVEVTGVLPGTVELVLQVIATCSTCTGSRIAGTKVEKLGILSF
jgi:hypothetical protein